MTKENRTVKFDTFGNQKKIAVHNNLRVALAASSIESMSMTPISFIIYRHKSIVIIAVSIKKLNTTNDAYIEVNDLPACAFVLELIL